MDKTDPESALGLNQGKYKIFRTDGSSNPGGKHRFCQYFVLDLQHDKFSVQALEAYASACEQEYPQLAVDIREKLKGTKLWFRDS